VSTATGRRTAEVVRRPPLPWAAYLRVSTQEQAEDGNGLAAQQYAIEQEGARHGWALDLFPDEGYSAKDTNRPKLQDALAALDRREYAGLVVAKLDRLSRSVLDFSELIQRAQRRRWNLVILDPQFDLSTPMGRAMAQMAAVFAQLERELIGQRTSEGLQALKRQGVRLGRPRQYGADLVALIATLRHEDGLSHRAVAKHLNEAAVPTVGGGPWRHSTVRRILRGLVLDQEAAAAREACASGPNSSRSPEGEA
jgi:DNA invertase Pin-like site-specific DNA recombinase